MRNMRNRYRVPKKQWKKWNEQEKTMFVDLMDTMIWSPLLFAHPKSPRIEPEYFRTVAWNASWMAAELLRERRKAGNR